MLPLFKAILVIRVLVAEVGKELLIDEIKDELTEFFQSDCHVSIE